MREPLLTHPVVILILAAVMISDARGLLRAAKLP